MNLIEELDNARKNLIKFVDEFPKEKREIVLFDEWGLKDILSHLTGWAKYQTDILKRFKKEGEIEVPINLKASINDDFVSHRAKCSWGKVYKEFANISGLLIKEYESLPAKLWGKNIYKGKKTTPKDFIKIEIVHYSKTHGPQINKILAIDKLTTDPQEELLTEVNLNNKVIGSIPREIAHNSPNKIYRTIYVVVKNTNGKILIQKRSATKDLYPNCWDLSVGGHVRYGKSYLETAVQEIKEELGLAVSKKDLILLGEVLVKLPTANEFFQVFEYNLKPSQVIRPETEEINQTKWLSVREIKESMKIGRLKWYPRPIQVIKALF